MRAILAAARSVSTHTLHVSSAFSSIVEQASLHCAAILRFVFVGELSAMFLAVSLVRACTLRRFRAVSAVGLSATLLGGCFVFEEGRRPFFDHAHYTPVGGQPEDIFIEPAGDVDRTIPNRLGRLDVAPVNYSFETDEAARKRAKLTLPPQPVIPPASKVAPQSRVLPGAQTGSQAGAQAAPVDDVHLAVPARPLRQRSPARPAAPGIAPGIVPGITPGVEIAPPLPPQTQSAAPALTDPVVGVVQSQGVPADTSWPTTVTSMVPPKS
jgi:hypothetical protein